MPFKTYVFMCKECGETHEIHLREHQPVPVFCDRTCQKAYSAKHRLPPKTYVCLNCKKTFTKKYSQKKPPIFCEMKCRTEFARKSIEEKWGKGI